MPRPTITKITLQIDGTRTIDIEPVDDTCALFFTDFAVNDILANYYNSTGEPQRATDLINDWNQENPDSGTLPVVVRKRPNCTYEIVY